MRADEVNAAAPRRLGLLIMRDLTMKGIVVGSRAMFKDMMDRMVEHDVRPVIDRCFSFEQANEALDCTKLGKVVIRI